MEEVVGTGDDDNWQIKRVSPGKDIAQWNGFVG